MQSHKQIVMRWLYDMFLQSEKDRLRRNGRSNGKAYVGTDLFRKDVVKAKYRATKKAMDEQELIGKPINTVIALMLTNPRRFVYNKTLTQRLEKRETLSGTTIRATIIDETWSVKVTDRVTKAVFKYDYDVHVKSTDYGRKVPRMARITGCTIKEDHWMKKAFRVLGQHRDTRVRKVRAYLEKRNMRSQRNILLELYPDGE